VKFNVHVDEASATSDVGAVVVKETPAGYVADVSAGAVPVGLTVVVSFDVERNIVVSTSVVPFTTPTVSVAAVEAASAQVLAPLLANVTTIVPPSVGSDPVAVQPVGKVVGVFSTTVGEVVSVVKPTGYVNMIVAPAAKDPVVEVVKPHVHVEAAFITSELGAVPVTVTVLTDVAVSVAPAVGAIAVVSADVATAKLAAPYVPAAPLTTAMLKVAAVEAASAHVPDFVVRLIVTTFSLLVSRPVALQFETKVVGVFKVISGAVVLVVKPRGNVTVIELPDERGPEEEVVKPTVHVDAVFATNDVGAVPVKLTVESDVAPALATLESPMMRPEITNNFVTVREKLFFIALSR
jgi:hypothetical protein